MTRPNLTGEEKQNISTGLQQLNNIYISLRMYDKAREICQFMIGSGPSEQREAFERQLSRFSHGQRQVPGRQPKWLSPKKKGPKEPRKNHHDQPLLTLGDITIKKGNSKRTR